MCHDQIKYLHSRSSTLCKDGTASVFDTTFNPNPEKGQYTPPIGHLAADAFQFILDGTDTTSHTLVTGLFELLDESRLHMMTRLKGELRNAIPHLCLTVAWASLENLPYLVKLSPSHFTL